MTKDTDPPVARLRAVEKAYVDPGRGDAVPVLRGVDFEIRAGQSAAVVGPSGCGKSTLLNVLGTLDRVDAGDVELLGRDATALAPADLAQLRARGIGFVFQLHHLLPQLTVLENVLLPALAAAAGDARGGAEQRAVELLESVGLAERASWKPARLSGGERQRAAVVRALINQPRLLLADEPTGALDAHNADRLTDLLLELPRRHGVALVMVTHHHGQAGKLDRVMEMRDGKLVQLAASEAAADTTDDATRSTRPADNPNPVSQQA